jgi:hypothetical protein
MLLVQLEHDRLVLFVRGGTQKAENRNIDLTGFCYWQGEEMWDWELVRWDSGRK